MRTSGIKSLIKAVRLAAQRSEEESTSFLRQLGEMLCLYIFYGIGPLYYQLAGLWQAHLVWNEKRYHVSHKEYKRYIDKLNHPAYRKISQYKLSEKAFLSILGIPTPEYIGFFSTRDGITPEGLPLKTPADLERLLDTLTGERLCFKLLEGHGGEGFRAVEVKQVNDGVAVLLLDDQHIVNIQQFCDDYLSFSLVGEYLIEKYFVQHPFYLGLNPSSVNTIRMLVIQVAGGTAVVLGAYVRVGREGSLVDNGNAGGIMVPIDTQTGITRRGFLVSPERREMDLHPDSNCQLSSLQLPMWKEIQELSCQVVRLLPNIRFAGLDIAVGLSGPTVIEVNVDPDKEGAAFVQVPLKRYFEDFV